MDDGQILDNATLKDNLLKARLASGLTQAKVAKLLDISLPAYQNIEHGKTRINPTYARTKVTKSVQLKKGWNVIEARGFCLGCPPFHIGACVRANEALLWKLKTSTFAK